MRTFRLLWFVVLGLITLPIIVAAVYVLLSLRIDLEPFRAQIETLATDQLGRMVRIEGPVVLHTSLTPAIEVVGLRISGRKAQHSQDFLQVSELGFSVDLMALLRGELRIGSFEGRGITAVFAVDADGSNNWEFDLPAGSVEGDAFVLTEVARAQLRDVTMVYRDTRSLSEVVLQIFQFDAVARQESPVQATWRGRFQEYPIHGKLRGSPLGKLGEFEAWSMEADLILGQMMLQVATDLRLEEKPGAKSFPFLLKGKDTMQLGTLIGSELPPLGPWRLSGRLFWGEKHYSVTELCATLPGLHLAATGNLDLRGGSEVWELSGNIDVPSVDIPAIHTALPALDPGVGLVALQPAGSSSGLTPEILNRLDVSLLARIGHITLDGPLSENLTLGLELHEGTLHVPVFGELAGAGLRGEAELRGQAEQWQLHSSMVMEGLELGRLPGSLNGSPDISGAISHASVSLSAQSTKLSELLNQSDISGLLQGFDLSVGNSEAARAIPASIREATFRVGPTRPLQVRATGSWMHEPVELQLTSATFTRLLQERSWPVTLEMNAAGARLQATGLVRPLFQHDSSELAIALSGQRFGDLARWLGIIPASTLPYNLRTTVRFNDRAVLFRNLQAELGRTRLAGNLGWSGFPDDPHLSIQLNVANLVLDELVEALENGSSRSKSEADTSLGLDLPVLPTGVAIEDTDLDLWVQELTFRTVDLRDVSLVTEIRNGWVRHSPFSARFEDMLIDGGFSLDLRDKRPELVLEMAAREVDLGRLLDRLQWTEGLVAGAQHMSLGMTLRGSTLGDMLAHSEYAATLQGGYWTLRDPNTAAALLLNLNSGTFRSYPGTPPTLELQASLNDVPIKIVFKSKRISEVAETKERWPFNVDVALPGAQVNLTGSVALPVEYQDIQVTWSVTGTRLDTLNDLVDKELPLWGPYQFHGHLQALPEGYFLSGLDVRIGDSNLRGSIRLRTASERPQLAVNLKSERLSLDDFPIDRWVFFEPGGNKRVSGQVETRVSRKTDKESSAALVNPRALEALDAQISIHVSQVTLAEEHLGAGTLHAKLQDGHFELEPLKLELPGGSMEVSYSLEYQGGQPLAELAAHVERLEYGIFARIIDPSTKADGWFYLDTHLRSLSPFTGFMRQANGHFDFAVWPENLIAGVFNWWAVNLLTTILPLLDSSGSKINCLVGRLNVDNGLLVPEALLIDSTRVQVRGSGQVDFQTQEIDMKFRPRAKRLQFVSLATPVRVKGNFERLGLGLDLQDLLGTIVRIGSAFYMPFVILFQGPLSTEDRAACNKALQRDSPSENVRPFTPGAPFQPSKARTKVEEEAKPEPRIPQFIDYD